MAPVSTPATQTATIRPTDPRLWPGAAICFAISAIAYILLRSHDILAVDGAVRSLLVFNNPTQTTVGSHTLYSFWVQRWASLLAFFGYHPASPIAYWRAIQVMNCLAAAACVTILYDLVRRVTCSRPTALFAAGAWGGAHAVLLHATNSAEPVLGLLFSVAGFSLTVHGLRRRSYLLLVLAGLTLAVAMESYRSMVFIAFACGLLTLFWPTRSRYSEPVRRAGTLTAAFVIGELAIFGTIAYLQGVRSLHQAGHLFVTTDAQDVYFGFTASKLLNSIVGYVNAFVVAVPPNYAGIRWLAAAHLRWLAWFVACALVVLPPSLVLLRRAVTDRESRVLLASCGASFLLGVVLICAWVPTYDKLWLQPLWLLVFMFAIAVQHARFRRLLALAIVAIVSVNVVAAARTASGPWPYFDGAHRLSSVLKANDLLIGGWSPISVVYRATNVKSRYSFDLPFEASEHRAQTIALLQQQIAAARQRGGQIYFLDVLDQTEPQWNAFLGEHCGVPYSSFQIYREQAREVMRFESGGITSRLMMLP